MEERFEAKYPAESWKNEIDKIVELVKAGNSSQIIGIPGIGRSNLLGVLAYNRKARQQHLGQTEYKKFHFVIMNFSEMRKKEHAEVLKFFFISIIDSLKERVMEDEYKHVQDLLKEVLETPDKQVLLHGLKKAVDYIAIEKGLTLIFLIDRFEEYIPTVSAEFFTDLRALRNRAKYKFSVVFSVNRPLEEVLEPSIYIDFYEFLEGNDIFLPLKDEPSLGFRIKFLREKASTKLSDETINQLLKLTSGHGKLARLSLEAFLSDKPEGKLSEFLLSKNKIYSLLFEIWNSLNPEEQKYLLKGGDIPSYLEKLTLVKDDKITIPLFESFIDSNNHKLVASSTLKIEYDEATNELKRGETTISNELTSSEFKLLKHLVLNSGKILDRDEVINSVWGDLSSTSGVSEQALDQLVFRVRKKIEENPNSPVHLETVKGRGFKFNP